MSRETTSRWLLTSSHHWVSSPDVETGQKYQNYSYCHWPSHSWHASELTLTLTHLGHFVSNINPLRFGFFQISLWLSTKLDYVCSECHIVGVPGSELQGTVRKGFHHRQQSSMSWLYVIGLTLTTASPYQNCVQLKLQINYNNYNCVRRKEELRNQLEPKWLIPAQVCLPFLECWNWSGTKWPTTWPTCTASLSSAQLKHVFDTQGKHKVKWKARALPRSCKWIRQEQAAGRLCRSTSG